MEGSRQNYKSKNMDDTKELKKKLKNFISDPIRFFAELHEIWRNEITNSDKISSKVLLLLQKEHNLDVCEMAANAMDSGTSVFDILHLLQDPFPQINHNTDSLINLIQRFHEGCKGDLLSGQQYNLIEKYTENKPELARDLLNKLITFKEPFVVQYIS